MTDLKSNADLADGVAMTDKLLGAVALRKLFLAFGLR
jgi:hypothetical protein